MAQGLITKASVDALKKDEDRDQFVWDTKIKGFGLKVTRTGARVYILQYRMGGREAKSKRYTIGKHGSMTPDDARKEAKRLSILVEQGTDPADADRLRRREAVTLAFGKYADTFVDSYLKDNWKDSWKEGKRILDKNIKPFFKSRPLTTITRADITEMLDQFSDRPATKKITHSVMRKLLRWAVDSGHLTYSPLTDTRGPKSVKKRDRVLSNEELVALWLATAKVSKLWQPVIRSLILTLQRRTEIAALDWRELRGDIWLIPPDRAKNDEGHRVPLTALALEQFAGLKQKKKGLVFTSTGTTAVSGFSDLKEALDKHMLEIMKERAEKRGEDPSDVDLPGWRFHDIRRTGTTMLQQLGFPIEVTEALINHISGKASGVAGVYNLYKYDREKRAAVEAWTTKLIELVEGKPTGSNVVELADRRA